MNKLSKKNPYKAGNPVYDQEGKKLFFGRQDMLSQVARELDNEATNALVLFGQRRIGKTSLLRQLEATLPDENFFSVYFDLQDRGREALGDVLGKLADQIAIRLGLPFPEEEFDNEGKIFRRIFMPQVYEHLGDDQHLVLLLDEFDVLDRAIDQQLDKVAATHSLFPFLRDMMSEDKRVSFVFVLGRRIEDLITAKEFQQTFKAAINTEVWLLDKKSTEDLVRQAEVEGSLRYTRAAITHIYHLTAGHPYLTQMLCQRIWHLADADTSTEPPLIDRDQVEAAIPNTLTAADAGLSWLWDGLSPAGQIYAAALAQIENQDEQTISQERIIQVLQDHATRLRTRQIEQSPRHLVDWRILEEKDLEKTGKPSYRYAVELIRRWVKERRPLRKVKEGLDKVVPLAEEFFQFGNKAAVNQEWDKAIRFYKDALRENEKHFRARLGLGEAFQEQGRLEEAIHELEKAYHQDRNEVHLSLMRALEAQMSARQQAGDEDGVLDSITRLLAIDSDHNEADALRIKIWMRRGDEARASGDLETAVNAYEKAGSQEAKQAANEMQREQKIRKKQLEAKDAVEQRNWTEASRLYAQLIDDFSNDERRREWEADLKESQQQVNVAHVLDGDAYKMLESREWENAINSYQNLLQRYPIHENRTIWKNNLSQAERGREAAKQFYQAQNYLKQGNLPKTLDLLQDLVTEQTDWEQGDMSAANLLNIVKNQMHIKETYEEKALWGEAIDAFEQHLVGASLSYEKKIWQGEIERCQREEKLLARFRQGERYLADKKWTEAIQAFGFVVGEYPNYRSNGKIASELLDQASLRKQGWTKELPAAFYKYLTPSRNLFGIAAVSFLLMAFLGWMLRDATQPPLPTATANMVEVVVTRLIAATPEVTVQEVPVTVKVTVVVPPTPTPGPPKLATPPSPATLPIATISVGSLQDIVSIDDMGIGRLSSLAYFPHDRDHRLFALASTAGLYIYDVEGNVVSSRVSQTPIIDIAFHENSLAKAVTSENESQITFWLVEENGVISQTEVTDSWDKPINGIAFSEDGRFLAASSPLGQIQLWKNDEELLIKTANIPPSEASTIYDVAFIVDGDESYLLAFASDSGTQLWQIDENGSASPQTLLQSATASHSVAFSRDGRFLISGTNDNKIQIWNTKPNSPPAIVDVNKVSAVNKDNTADIRTMAYSPTDNLLITAASNLIYVWQNSGEQIRLLQIFPGHQATIESLAFSPDGKTLISLSDSEVIKWPIYPPIPDLVADEGHEASVTDIAFSSNEAIFASASEDGDLFLWRTKDRAKCSLGHSSQQITALAFTKFVDDEIEYEILVAGSDDGILHLWQIPPEPHENDCANVIPLRQLEASGRVNDLSFSRNGFLLAAGLDSDIDVVVWHRPSVEGTPSFEWLEDFRVTTLGGGAGSVIFSPIDENKLAIGAANGLVQLWQIDNPVIDGNRSNLADIQPFPQQSVSVDQLVFSANGANLLASFRDKAVQIISLTTTPPDDEENPESVEMTLSHLLDQRANNRINDISLLPDDTLLALASSNGKVDIWEWESEGSVRSIVEYDKAVTNMAISGFADQATAHVIVLGFEDGTISIHGLSSD